MITVDQILGFARDAINTDAAIASWMTTNYSATLKVYVGVDLSDPPSEADCPFVVLSASPSDYEVGETAEDLRPVFEVDFALLDTAKSTSGNVTTYAGQANICALAELIRAALLTKFDNRHFESCKLSFVGVAPLWQGGMTVGLLYEQAIGSVTVAVNPITNQVEAAPSALPAAVTGFVTSGWATTTVNVQWTGVSPAPAHYRLEQAPDVAGIPGTWALKSLVLPPLISYQFTGLTPTTKYWFRIKSVNLYGSSAYTMITVTTI